MDSGEVGAMKQPMSDFVIFEEFAHVFETSPEILRMLVPGTFSPEWTLREYRPQNVDPCPASFVKPSPATHALLTECVFNTCQHI